MRSAANHTVEARRRFATFILLAVATTLPLGAEERLAHIFQDNMVLQREMPVPIWGWSAPGGQVEIAFATQKKQSKADEHGYWKVLLDPLAANRVGQTLEVRIGTTTVSRKNIVIGEVWLAAGQSNMVVGGPDKDTGVYPHYVSPGTGGGKPEIRTCSFGWGASLEPLPDTDPVGRDAALWNVLPENPTPPALGISAYFARVVRDALDVPVGIILVAVPGTNQSAWMARETLEGFPGKINNFYQEFLAEKEDKLAKSNEVLKSWADFKRVETAWREERKGTWPGTGQTFINYPTVLYNTRIVPLAPFVFRGAIWHQGEAGPGGPYGERLVAMIKQWRGLFGQDFAFVWGTLARSTTQPPPLFPLRSWYYCSANNIEIRKALTVFGGDKKTALVDFYDLGNEETHWTQKAEAGRRMGLAALTIAYGQQHLYTGPRLAESTITGGKAMVRFDHVGDGLIYKPSINGISGVCLRSKGANGVLRWGQVTIVSKDTIEVSHPDIAELETVAYAENPNPHETLFNNAGLPASPFTVNPVTPALYAGDAACSASPRLVSLVDGQANAIMHISHVRRSGYVFQLIPKDHKAAPIPIALRGYIPVEWKGFEVRVAGKPVEIQETTTDGDHFVTFSATSDRTWVVIAEAGKAGEFSAINRF